MIIASRFSLSEAETNLPLYPAQPSEEAMKSASEEARSIITIIIAIIIACETKSRRGIRHTYFVTVDAKSCLFPPFLVGEKAEVFKREGDINARQSLPSSGIYFPRRHDFVLLGPSGMVEAFPTQTMHTWATYWRANLQLGLHVSNIYSRALARSRS